MQIFNVIYFIAVLLVVIGGINWGLIGLHKKYNLVELFTNKLFKGNQKVSNTIYILVGISALIVLFGNLVLLKNYKTDLPYQY